MMKRATLISYEDFPFEDQLPAVHDKPGESRQAMVLTDIGES